MTATKESAMFSAWETPRRRQLASLSLPTGPTGWTIGYSSPQSSTPRPESLIAISHSTGTTQTVSPVAIQWQSAPNAAEAPAGRHRYTTARGRTRAVWVQKNGVFGSLECVLLQPHPLLISGSGVRVPGGVVGR